MGVMAKVVFTGYSELRFTPQGVLEISGSDSALALLGRDRRETTTRSFSINNLGLFAATSFNERFDFLIDFTYRRIATTVGETRIQYAYLHYHNAALWEVKAGKVTVPAGIYNENYFYPFARVPLSPPVFQSSILGLPFADLGLIVAKTWALKPMDLQLSLFAVNGYGPAQAGTQVFRGGLGIVDGLSVASNQGAVNSNEEFTYGAKGQIAFLPQRKAKVGLSAKRGPWDREGKYDFTHASAFGEVTLGDWQLLTEALGVEVEGDEGMARFFGDKGWRSAAVFLETSYAFWKREGRKITGFVGAEIARGEGLGPASLGEEKIDRYKLGVVWYEGEHIQVKAEASRLGYSIPFLPGGVRESLDLTSTQWTTGLILLF